MSRPVGWLLRAPEHDPMVIIREVARGFGLSHHDIIGPSRRRHICVARSCAMAVVRETTSLSYPAIGEVFDRDHTTVMHACRKVMADPVLAESVRLVVQELSPPPTLFSVEVVADQREAM